MNDEPNKCKICQKEALQKCGGCQNIFYCSKEHQKADWKQHRKNCQPFKVSSNCVIGRYLITTRDLKRNEIILKEKPLIYGPAQETIPVCLGCNQEISPKYYRPCSRCGWPMCSNKCEKDSCHLPECYYMSRSGEQISIENFGDINPFYKSITVLRCLYQKNHNSNLWKKLNTLESHCEQRKSTQRYHNDKLLATQLIQKLFKLEKDFDVEEIMRICGIILVNAHEVPLSEPPYIAIYEKTSMFENDCSSNCSKSFTAAGEILISAGKNIKKGDHLSISYADPLWSTINRRNFLNETKFFWCECTRCSDPTEFGTNFSAVCCQNKKCDGYLLPKNFLYSDEEIQNWNCNKCDYSVSSCLVSTLLEKISNEISVLDKNSVDQCKRFVNKLRKILPKNNFQLVDVKLALSQLIGQDKGLLEISSEDLELKRSLCKELVGLTETLISSEKRVRGLLLFELHASLAELARRRFSNFLQAHSLLEESKIYLLECIELLKYEPEVLPEGKVCDQARRNLYDLTQLLHK